MMATRLNWAINLSWLGALTIGSWLAMAVGPGSPQAAAQPFAANSGSAPTYGGRDFYEWQRLATTDLEADTRFKSMLALSALGQTGRHQEAIETLQIVLGNEPHPLVRSVAYLALMTFGEPAYPAVDAGFTSEASGEQQITLYAVADFFAPLEGAASEDRISPLPSAERLPPASTLPDRLIPQLVEILQDRNRANRDRRTAARALGGIYRTHPSGALADSVRKAAVAVARQAEVELSSAAIGLLGQLGVHARPAVPFLAELAERNDNVVEPRSLRQQSIPDRFRLLSRPIAATEALTELGIHAEEALPTLERLRKVRRGREVYVAGLAARAVRTIRSELTAQFELEAEAESEAEAKSEAVEQSVEQTRSQNAGSAP